MAGNEQAGFAGVESAVLVMHQGIAALLSSLLMVGVMAVVLVALSAIWQSAHR